MKRILAISDLHVGSNVGLALPEFEDDMTYIGNSVTNFLWENWIQMIDRVGKVDAVFLNGDIVEGPNKAESGRGVWNTDIHVQAKAATQLLKMLKTDSFYCTQGSTYHTGNPSGDRIVCDMIGGNWLESYQFINIENLLFYMRHHGDFSSNPASRTGPQQKESMVARSQDTKVDVFIRSHCHSFYGSVNAYDLSVNVPCWKGIDGYIGKKSIEKPDNGYILFEVDGAEYDWKYNIFNVPHQLYNRTIKI